MLINTIYSLSRSRKAAIASPGHPPLSSSLTVLAPFLSRSSGRKLPQPIAHPRYRSWCGGTVFLPPRRSGTGRLARVAILQKGARQKLDSRANTTLPDTLPSNLPDRARGAIGHPRKRTAPGSTVGT
ncbi:hypothetical protein HMPREF0281_00341 [Corynebacterium ammoniagenes DSM 20306]|uniref:Uncharacterized protein n=1 Tax=Corynebacterium ammoniagenes DSM 20306 TaxID=649754 RepID=A0ABP2IFM8_CORAM|nr:hypothetical protein HMPREF0281_00341 [Corynebacterium ammoniagenes DSM 20306]